MPAPVVLRPRHHGLDHAQGRLRGLWYYTVGEILVRARTQRRRAEGAPAAPSGPFFGGADPARVPRLAAVGNRWPELAERDIYRQGLRAFVDGLLAQAGRAS
ncbi:hypothetical protein ACFPZ0_01425 [Streptomonospora nanhaiensis]|uniref:Tetracycline repressor TetR C-terminal domain-containing protein n=1 Tax=Streptomonospora nanhaiensis TaxID=1323731 RepID=A0A853BMN9_9ACTN|nr:hypothetical protein [Streptomonospora nanhaiensis]MBV2365765.1 hypothetical protein [Streptomonospora nanhaiensis]MBX9388088.1 hypothetical protein [Streptomonospora nanhaiensis]NYI96483.1 hypothetical protein [Streptomonospora nanhaiensis]